jgi:proton glutamate symport protein
MTSLFQKPIVRFLKSPLGIITGVVLGLLTGHIFPEFGHAFGPLGHIFVSLMKMCIIPIIVTSVSVSLCELLTAKIDKNVTKIIMVFASFILVSSIVGVVSAYIGNPGHSINENASSTLKSASVAAAIVDRDLDEPTERRLDKGVMTFILNAVPDNIVMAMTKDQFFQMVVFSFIFGIALSFVAKEYQAPTQMFLESVRVIFEQIVITITIFLPIAVFLIMSHDVTTVGGGTYLSMARFVLTAYAAFIFMFVIGLLIICYYTRTSIGLALNYMKEPLFVALATHSGDAAIPAAISTMRDKFKLSEDLVDIFVPIGTIMGQFSNVMYFSFATVFIAQFYGVNLTITEYLFITLMSVLASWSAIGAHGALSLPLIALILDPLGLPLSGVIVLLIAIDPLMDAGLSVMRVHINSAAVSIIATKRKPKKQKG